MTMALSAQQVPVMDYPTAVSSTDDSGGGVGHHEHLVYQSTAAAAASNQLYQQQQQPQTYLHTLGQQPPQHPDWCQQPYAQQYTTSNVNNQSGPYHPHQPQYQQPGAQIANSCHSAELKSLQGEHILSGDFHMAQLEPANENRLQFPTHSEPYPQFGILSPQPTPTTSSSTCDSPPEFAVAAHHHRTPNNGQRQVQAAEAAVAAESGGLLSTPSSGSNHHHHQSSAAAGATAAAWSGGLSGSGGGGAPGSAENSRRGRPRSEALTTLMIEGSTSPSAIKCTFCNRVFPREKSLQAHLRTHTGERPYPCDYPGCTRAFTQSGQLKTHQRLHTGERPFMCSALACQQRFTHANRHCPDHPYGSLRRCDDSINVASSSEQNTEVLRWLEKYRAEKEERTPSRRTPKRTPKRVSWSAKSKASASALAADGASGAKSTGAVAGAVNNIAANANQENMPMNGSLLGVGNGYATVGHHPNSGAHSMAIGPAGAGTPVAGGHHAAGGSSSSCAASPSTPINPRKSRKGLMVELDMNAGMGASPIATKLKAPQPKQIQWTEAPMSQEEDSADDDCDDDGDCDDDDDDDGFEAPTAQSTFNPKKRWLREAWQDDLARPLEPQPLGGPIGFGGAAAAAVVVAQPGILGEQQPLHMLQQQQQPPAQSAAISSSAAAMTAAAAASYINPNQMRPSVLMIASKDRTMPLVEHQRQMYAQQPSYADLQYATPSAATQQQSSAAASCFATTTSTSISSSPNTPNRKWMGAMALMQLSSNEEAATLAAAGSHTSSPSITSSRPESGTLELAAQQFQLYRAKP